jgi:hypothetical protein
MMWPDTWGSRPLIDQHQLTLHVRGGRCVIVAPYPERGWARIGELAAVDPQLRELADGDLVRFHAVNGDPVIYRVAMVPGGPIIGLERVVEL